MLRKLGIAPVTIFACIVIFVVSQFAAGQENISSFEEALALAHAYDPWELSTETGKDPALAMAYYRRAVALRPDSPENMWLLLTAADLNVYDNNTREAQLARLKGLEEILERFDHMDYYRLFTFQRGERWHMMISVAIHAGELRQVVFGQSEEGRAHYYNGMVMLRDTYQRRVDEWLQAPEPQQPSRVFTDGWGDDWAGEWEWRKNKWKARQESAKAGTVFEEENMAKILVKSTVRKYIETLGRLEPWQLAKTLEPLLEEFAGTPLETEMRLLIAEEEKLMADMVAAEVGAVINDPTLTEHGENFAYSDNDRVGKDVITIQPAHVSSEESMSGATRGVILQYLVAVFVLAIIGRMALWRLGNRGQSSSARDQ